MGLRGTISALLLLIPSILVQATNSNDTFYLLAVTSKTVGGTTETFCVTVIPSECVSIEVTLEYNQHNRLTLLKEDFIQQDYHLCVPFQVPVVSVDTVASIRVYIKGIKTVLNKTTEILITPPTELNIIETDKPVYKPGQTVMFRIVSLDTNFLTHNQMFLTIEIQDPNSNRIGQWMKVTTHSGLLDLSYPINSEAMEGFYLITARDEKNNPVTRTFEVKDYVLPKFEVTVTFPSVMTILETNAVLKVCANYTYGKPVNGTVTATICRNSYRNWFLPTGATPLPNICRSYKTETDASGCGERVLNLMDFALTDSRYESVITAQCEVEEHGTGVILTGSARSSITTNIITLSFADSPTTFRLGMTYEGKIQATDPKSNPIKSKVVILTVSYSTNIKTVQKLITNTNGIAEFTLSTESWGSNTISLQAQYETTDTPATGGTNQLKPYYPTASLSLQPFYSKSQSFIKLNSSSKAFSCKQNGVIGAQYMIHNSALRPNQNTLSFFYMVINKGQLVQRGQIIENLDHGTVHKGNLVVTLQKMQKVTPVAQVVLYTVLPNGEAVADSKNFPIELCLANEVSLKFSSSPELPGGQTSLTLKAAPGSLCSVKAIDQSLLLLQPEKELNIQSVFNMLPFQTLSGYPYNINDEHVNTCGPSPLIKNIALIRLPPNPGKVDVYNMFKGVGIKILTNADVNKPSNCVPGILSMSANRVSKDVQPVAMAAPLAPINDASAAPTSSSNQPVVTVRTYFPETWIWDLVPVSDSGVTAINKTVPDSITTWHAGAFCTSPIGFGVAPSAELTAFQPFFVSLTMPSSVIRGEVFTLKATIFNYLQSCMMVKVTLAQSKQFSVQVCVGCSYTQYLCADESWTFSWTFTALVLGKVSINVTAEAVQSTSLCSKSPVTVPEKGRIDTIINTLLVKPEGKKVYTTFNMLLCPQDGTAEEKISLTLPAVYVEGSATASVSVLGDLMGRALQNLASLLAMPYGCGEQNMLNFAPNIFIMKYLQSTNQLTPAVRSTANNYLVNGYQRELNYKHTDGSYSAFGMSDPSGNTWLTAFVMKSFGNARPFIFIDGAVLDQAKAWLGRQQQADGCFASVGKLIHTNMQGGVNDAVTLSAYVTAAMMELDYTVTDPVVNKSLTCLRNACPKVSSTYTKALLFYTFTLARDQGMRSSLMTDLGSQAIISADGRHWSNANDKSVKNSLGVEITSYVLLGLMSGPVIAWFDVGYSASIVHWLSRQQNSFGGFESTQDTVVALQALAKYSLATYSPQGALTVTVTSPSGLKNTFNITQSNRLLYQEAQLQEVPGNYSVNAKGQGCVYVQFSLQYNIPPPPDQSLFTISASASGNCKVQNPSLLLTVTVTYNGQRSETNMVIIDIKPLSGFSLKKTSVHLMNSTTNSNGAVKRVDQRDGDTFIYLDGLTRGEKKVYTMTIVQDIVVNNLKPAVVTVYDYYETNEKAVTVYTSPCVAQ
ncbi:alpha-2-macroglobulin-like protein 1 [Clarias gariepinus]|uniref:alpha-2-macroglobulin-like protein 1 n=1 Tax=Clarias gariepinus TaxID=13013 RepID=UPI00234DF799|nr:alpha-2-macroglobulin-like protein 1 [Clarias gariepinus]